MCEEELVLEVLEVLDEKVGDFLVVVVGLEGG